VVVGVGDPGHQPAGVGGDVVPVQPVVEGLEQHEQPGEQRDLHLRGAGELVALRLEPDPAEQVVHDAGHEQPDEGRGHPEADQEVQPRQLEDVKMTEPS
jgi:hypothetical protein